MMNKMTFAFLVIFSASLAARADISTLTHRSGFYFGGGLHKSMTSIENESAEAQFDGWGYALEVGTHLAWNRKMGNVFAAEYKRADLINKQKETVAIEKADLSSTTVKAGFFLNNFSFTYGQSKDSAEIKQVSSNTGTSSSKINGTIKELGLSYNINVQNDYRLSFELQKRDGDLADYEMNEIKVLMKFFVLHPF